MASKIVIALTTLVICAGLMVGAYVVHELLLRAAKANSQMQRDRVPKNLEQNNFNSTNQTFLEESNVNQTQGVVDLLGNSTEEMVTKISTPTRAPKILKIEAAKKAGCDLETPAEKLKDMMTSIGHTIVDSLKKACEASGFCKPVKAEC